MPTCLAFARRAANHRCLIPPAYRHFDTEILHA